MATIKNSESEIIKELLIERGLKPTYLVKDRKRLIEAVNCDMVTIWN